jgi:hypothetical protein
MRGRGFPSLPDEGPGLGTGGARCWRRDLSGGRFRGSKREQGGLLERHALRERGRLLFAFFLRVLLARISRSAGIRRHAGLPRHARQASRGEAAREVRSAGDGERPGSRLALGAAGSGIAPVVPCAGPVLGVTGHGTGPGVFGSGLWAGSVGAGGPVRGIRVHGSAP